MNDDWNQWLELFCAEVCRVPLLEVLQYELPLEYPNKALKDGARVLTWPGRHRDPAMQARAA